MAVEGGREGAPTDSGRHYGEEEVSQRGRKEGSRHVVCSPLGSAVNFYLPVGLRGEKRGRMLGDGWRFQENLKLFRYI